MEILLSPPFFKILILILSAVLQNMVGFACNYRIPQANLHAGLNFVHAKNGDHCTYY
jgi:hypothetical protein